MCTPHINTDELKQAYRRSGLSRIGMSFDVARRAPLIRWAMTRCAIAHRERQCNAPLQTRLI